MADTEELAKAVRSAMWQYYEATKSTAKLHRITDETLRSIEGYALDRATDPVAHSAR